MGTEEQWVQRNSGYRETAGTEEQWDQRNRGTVGTEEQWVQRNRGTVGTAEQWVQRETMYSGTMYVIKRLQRGYFLQVLVLSGPKLHTNPSL